jgi:hypothetical protein
MRHFFIGLFITSLLATGGAYYWRAYLPENNVEIFYSCPNKPDGSAPEQTMCIRSEMWPSSRQRDVLIIAIVLSCVSAIGSAYQIWWRNRPAQPNP